MPEVDRCYIMTGGTDILVHLVVKDIDELNNFITRKLRNMEGVQSTLTSIVLSDVSANTQLKALNSVKI